MNVPWVNAILHTGALIQKKKAFLATAHSWKSIWLIISLILLEVWLVVISIPLYLVQPASENSSGGQQYRVRRLITLSLLLVLGLIWLLKLALAGLATYYWNEAPQLQTQDTAQATSLSHEQLFAINQAAIEPNHPLVTITSAHESDNGTVTIAGQAVPKSHVLVYIARTDNDATQSESEKLTIVTTEANESGAWQVRLSEYRFRFLAGTYSTQAVWYDQAKDIKSPLSPAMTFTVLHDPPTPEALIRQADWWLNVLLLCFIIGAITLTLILT